MRKIWNWLKTHWKWLIFPLWALSVILVWVLNGNGKSIGPLTGTKDEDADTALKARDDALAKFRTRLDEIAKQAEKRLQGASEQQVKEFDEIKDEPLDEVAKWIDTLS